MDLEQRLSAARRAKLRGIKRTAILLIALAILAFTASLVLYRPRPGNPHPQPQSTIEASLTVPPRIDAMLHRACYDCHSNETAWPWYSAMPPASWLISRDVSRGRKALNFSDWREGSGRTPEIAAASLAAACDGVRTGKMPKWTYRLMHPQARLSSPDIRALCAWTSSESRMLTITNNSEAEHP